MITNNATTNQPQQYKPRNGARAAFPYKTDNVLLSYKQVPLITSAWASLESGAASFVSCDGEQPQDVVPPGTLQLPVAAHAIIIVYNVPNVTASLVLTFSLNNHGIGHMCVVLSSDKRSLVVN